MAMVLLRVGIGDASPDEVGAGLDHDAVAEHA